MNPAFRNLVLLCGWLTAAAFAEAKPLVVATLKPVALIASEVLGTTAEVRQLLPENASPHAYALRMSERSLLAEADLVLWIGPDLESFLAETLRTKPADQVLTAANLPEIHWPPGGHEGGTDDHQADLHLWLDPRNAAAMADGLVAALTARGYPVPSVAATGFRTRMMQLEADIRTRLAALPVRSFAADHAAFGHFAARFGLTPAGHLRDAADHATGARSMAALTVRTDIRCLIAEPDSEPGRMQHLAERLGARVQVVDALGAGISLDGGGGYERLMHAVTDAFARCLGDSGPP